MDGVIGLQCEIFEAKSITFLRDTINEFVISKKVYAITHSSNNGYTVITIWYTD